VLSPQAYRLLAKRHHPDKGGDPAAFARLQAAFEVLSDPRKRQVYDTWAKELQFRCVLCNGWASSHEGMHGGEWMVLRVFEGAGVRQRTGARRRQRQ
jgi:curved DNA-binding protein CbpA